MYWWLSTAAQCRAVGSILSHQSEASTLLLSQRLTSPSTLSLGAFEHFETPWVQRTLPEGWKEDDDGRLVCMARDFYFEDREADINGGCCE